MPANNQTPVTDNRPSTNIGGMRLKVRQNALENSRDEMIAAMEAMTEHERLLRRLSPEAAEAVREVSRCWQHSESAMREAQGTLNQIQNLHEKFELDTEELVFRDRKLKDSEYQHDRRMKIQNAFIAVAQRAGTAIAITVVMVVMLGLATSMHWPVPRLIAPVPAGSTISCKEDEAFLKALAPVLIQSLSSPVVEPPNPGTKVVPPLLP